MPNNILDYPPTDARELAKGSWVTIHSYAEEHDPDYWTRKGNLILHVSRRLKGVPFQLVCDPVLPFVIVRDFSGAIQITLDVREVSLTLLDRFQAKAMAGTMRIDPRINYRIEEDDDLGTPMSALEFLGIEPWSDEDDD